MSQRLLWEQSLPLAELLIKVTAIMVIVSLIVSMLRSKKPSTCHLIWLLAFVAVLALPVVTPLVPRTTVLSLKVSNSANLADVRHRAGDFAQNTSFTHVRTSANYQSGSNSVIDGVGSKLSLFSPYHAVLVFFFGIWTIGCLVVLFRIVIGLNSLRVIKRFGTRPITDEALVPSLDRLAGIARVRRSWTLRISNGRELSVPMTWGVICPTIVLPMEAESWPRSQFEAVLLHELAHVRRYDFLSQLISEIVCAIHWFNPAIWHSARIMRSDAELAADEAVLRAGLLPSDYAAELLRVASSINPQRQSLAYLGTPVMNNSKIETRLKSVLAPTAGTRGVTSLQALAAVAVAIIAIPALASIHASTQGEVTPVQTAADRTEALSRIKQAALASLMYANDYDDVYPYVQQTATAKALFMPYSKDAKIFESPAPNGRFVFNMNLAGVSPTVIPDPAQTPMWMEIIPHSDVRTANAFSDGHAKLVGAFGQAELKKRAAERFSRAKNSKPLPANYLVNKKSH